MEVYMVGGAVRDLAMGMHPNDYDYVVVGSTPEEMVASGYKQVGADFPVFLHPASGEEYALARIDRKIGVGYGGFASQFAPSVTLVEDLYRRDLTMNAMAHPVDGFDEDGQPYFDFHHSRIIDPYNGLKDIEFGYIRHVSDAFREDPVRLLRAARFAGRYRFAIHPDTMALLSQMVKDGELNHLQPDRVWKEMSQGLMTYHPELFFDVLRRCNAMWDFKVYMGGVAQWKIGNLVALEHRPLRIRFACISEMFGMEGKKYDAHRIPKECKDLAITLWTCLGVALCYTDYSSRDRVQWITRMGGLGSKRATSMFTDFLQAVRIVAPTKRYDNNWQTELRALERDQEILIGEDLGPVLANLPKGSNVGQIVEDHYVDVLDKFAAKYK